MSLIDFPKDFPSLKGKTVVITGGSSGMGEGFVRLACKNGANVVFGDLNSDLGERVAKETGATFVQTNVTVYKDQLGLFREASRKYGKIDHAIANAGIYEPKGWYDPKLDAESVEEEPSTLVFDVNIRGATFFTHIASVYLMQGRSSEDDRSITIISSVSGIHCPADTPLYNTSKAGMLGITRSLCQILPTSHCIRVNAICPSITRTPLAAAHILPLFEAAGIEINSPTDIAEKISGLLCGSKMNGKVLYVQGGKAYDIEVGLQRTMPEWLGPEISEVNRKVGEQAKKLNSQWRDDGSTFQL